MSKRKRVEFDGEVTMSVPLSDVFSAVREEGYVPCHVEDLLNVQRLIGKGHIEQAADAVERMITGAPDQQKQWAQVRAGAHPFLSLPQQQAASPSSSDSASASQSTSQPSSEEQASVPA